MILLRRKALDATPLITLTTPVVDAAGGQFAISLTNAQTAALTAGESPEATESRAVWDCELVDAAGRVTALYWGSVTIHREVTR